MGRAIEQQEFAQEAYQQFEKVLQEQLARLKSMLADPGFGIGERTLGAEVELYLIDDQGRPVCQNREILAALPEAGLALEINRYNLELNLQPVTAAGEPFSRMAAEMVHKIGRINAAAQSARALPIGILPTLQRTDFGPQIITPEKRYAVLSRVLREIRGDSFEIAISGEPDLQMQTEDVTLEGANTSLQIHLRVAPDEFADWFNAAQLVTPILVGLAANSPILFGHRLWHETRIPLFRQSIDGRSSEECSRAIPSRVDLGSGWVRQGAYELFSELVHLHPPILPIVESDQGPSELRELRLHSGTVWPWNRAVYDPADGGHLRIELRALPAGPTVKDMLANAAMLIGLTAAFAARMPEWVNRLPFETLASNFYAAAQHGIEAQLYWPDAQGHAGLKPHKVADLAASLLDEARVGLNLLKVDQAEIEASLAPMRARIEKRQNGASWMLKRHEQLSKLMPPEAALRTLVIEYQEHSGGGLCVADWPLQ